MKVCADHYSEKGLSHDGSFDGTLGSFFFNGQYPARPFPSVRAGLGLDDLVIRTAAVHFDERVLKAGEYGLLLLPPPGRWNREYVPKHLFPGVELWRGQSRQIQLQEWQIRGLLARPRAGRMGEEMQRRCYTVPLL